ncbi:family 14 glycosylhydrolase [Subtercola boreus]|uniref:Beta-amylase n=1 Tax=Subtercola boreus TaxID=120213 RepID=A0A3E0WBP5_9MICO|nr:family 14 glycosylhydrolase [Subtercola boreus]RFA20353.1 hypothetical protein B7R24_10170 [Subtercola boreus]RFA20507.1 hypothetical protein B7R23_10110 [Subtercola boreus]RFA26756.1 hypothetical protein B7R25_10235 [Subtercola boreus]
MTTQHHPRSEHRPTHPFRRLLAVAAVTTVLAGGVVSLPTAALAATGDSPTVNAMAPLWMADWASDGPQWQAFTRQLTEFKRIGGTGISVDVWWGKAALTPTSYSWGYYDKTFAAIKAAGLSIVPVMSFHQCGGNVGDDGDCKTPITIPSFVWDPMTVGGIVGTRPADNYYQSEYGNISRETVSPWGLTAARTYQQMKNFMNAFEDHFSSGATDLRGSISEVALSAGASGELREPSYNAHDAGVAGSPASYPNRGVLQTYSPAAKSSFTAWVLAKYGSVAGAASAWGIPGLTLDTISAPNDHANFFTSGAFKNITYGKDFTNWNTQSLVGHGRKVLNAAIEAFDGAFANVDLSEKIPGVHWQTMSASSIQRVPEVAAGLISTDTDMNSAATGHGYRPILTMISDVNVHGDGTLPVTHHIVLHFTELEKTNLVDDDIYKGAYSAAADQVGWIADAAWDAGVELKGENALNGGLYSDGDATHAGWSHIRQAFDRDPVRRFYGLTVLRLSDVATPGAAETGMANFIRDYK